MANRLAADPTAIRLTSYIPNMPEAPQHAFLWLGCKEAFYGGAAGGGKSDALLMGALQYVDQPNYAAIIFRRTYTDLSLPGALMSRAKEWLAGTDARWNDTEKTWHFPSGASLTFGYLDNENHKYRYQSAEFNYIAFDELTQFPEEDYLYLFSRLRRQSTSEIPVRMRGASNPGGKGHFWVKERFIDSGAAAGVSDRVFIPAKLDDNPHIDRESYVESLEELDPQTRKQLLEGDWNARQPGEWYFEAPDLDAVERLGAEFDASRPDPLGPAIQLGIDWGEHTQAYVIWPLERAGIYIPYSEVVSIRRDPAEASRVMLNTAKKFEHPLTEARYDRAGVQSMRTFTTIARQEGYPFLKITGVPFNKFKSMGALYMRLLAARAGRGERTQVLAISPRNKTLCRQLRMLESDPEGNCWLKDEDQHGPDAIVAGVAPVAHRHLVALRREVSTEKAAA